MVENVSIEDKIPCWWSLSKETRVSAKKRLQDADFQTPWSLFLRDERTELPESKRPPKLRKIGQTEIEVERESEPPVLESVEQEDEQPSECEPEQQIPKFNYLGSACNLEARVPSDQQGNEILKSFQNIEVIKSLTDDENIYAGLDLAVSYPSSILKKVEKNMRRYAPKIGKDVSQKSFNLSANLVSLSLPPSKFPSYPSSGVQQNPDESFIDRAFKFFRLPRRPWGEMARVAKTKTVITGADNSSAGSLESWIVSTVVNSSIYQPPLPLITPMGSIQESSKVFTEDALESGEDVPLTVKGDLVSILLLLCSPGDSSASSAGRIAETGLATIRMTGPTGRQFGKLDSSFASVLLPLMLFGFVQISVSVAKSCLLNRQLTNMDHLPYTIHVFASAEFLNLQRGTGHKKASYRKWLHMLSPEAAALMHSCVSRLFGLVLQWPVARPSVLSALSDQSNPFQSYWTSNDSWSFDDDRIITAGSSGKLDLDSSSEIGTGDIYEESRDGGGNLEDDEPDSAEMKEFNNSIFGCGDLGQIETIDLKLSDELIDSKIFRSDLRKYQKECLVWMTRNESQDQPPINKNNKKTKKIITSFSDSNVTESEGNGDSMDDVNPLWTVFTWPKDMPQIEFIKSVVSPEPIDPIAPSSEEISFSFSLSTKFIYVDHTGEVSLVPPAGPNDCRGGVLADEMGLGKTVEMLSLIASDFKSSDVKWRPWNVETSPSTETTGREPKVIRTSVPAGVGVDGCTQRLLSSSLEYRGGNLIILPTSLVDQWRGEIFRHLNCADFGITVHEYHGSFRETSAFRLSQKDIILTTYGTVLSEMQHMMDSTSKNQPNGKIQTPSLSPLLKVHFHRIILDEAHFIKNRFSRTSRAVCLLSSDRKWALTGTPIQNCLDDFYPLLRFLGVVCWSQYAYWRKLCTNNKTVSKIQIRPARTARQAKLSDSKDGSIEDLIGDVDSITRLRKVCVGLLLRRTGEMIDKETGRPIVELPPKTVIKIWFDLIGEEESHYRELFTKSKLELQNTLRNASLQRSSSWYTHILRLLTLLRQACCHPRLTSITALRSQGGVKIFQLDELNTEVAVRKLRGPHVSELSESFAKSQLAKAKQLVLSKGQEKILLSNAVHSCLDFEVENLYEFEKLVPDPCTICQETPQDPVFLPCMHILCYGCAVENLKNESTMCSPQKPLARKVTACPLCKQVYATSDLRKMTTEPKTDSQTYDKLLKASMEQVSDFPLPDSCLSAAFVDVCYSTKLAVVETVVRTAAAHGLKTVVFSQWVSMLDIVAFVLEKRGIEARRFDGSMSRKQRTSVVQWFEEDFEIPVRMKYEVKNEIKMEDGIPNLAQLLLLESEVNYISVETGSRSCSGDLNRDNLYIGNSDDDMRGRKTLKAKTLLISLKAGGVGLNLTAACVLIMMDAWWNPAVEQQAIQRVYRIGQQKPVQIIQMYAKDTVEPNILELQKSKSAHFESFMSQKNVPMERIQLTTDDLVSLFSCSKYER